MQAQIPLAMAAISLLLVTLGHVRAQRRARAANAPRVSLPVLIHSINPDRCTGCEACVTVCPTRVLELTAHKATVARFGDCIQCRQCMDVCPTQALVMHREDVAPPVVRAPALDAFGQTVVPGMYLIGEASGRPLVKNAANLGRLVIEHAVRAGIPRAGGADLVDVAIVGSGPGGLAAALSCRARGLTSVVLEKEQVIASTIARYPRGKLVMSEPHDVKNLSLLPTRDAHKEEIVAEWTQLIATAKIPIRLGESVTAIERDAQGFFTVRTGVGAHRARRVVLAVGTRGRPRTLNVPGENLAKVSPNLSDPTAHAGQHVLVVGGGDSALEAAAALATHGARVILSYRGRSFGKAKAANVQRVNDLAAKGQVEVLLGSTVAEVRPASVVLNLGAARREAPNHAMYVLIGADAPVAWLTSLGVTFVDKPHMCPEPPTDRQLMALVGPAAAPLRAIDELGDDEPTRIDARPATAVRAARDITRVIRSRTRAG